MISDPLEKNVIRQHVNARFTPGSVDVTGDLIASVDVVQSIDSTNSYLLEQQALIGKAKICVAEAQISGRGRRGNDWLSAPNKNIMMSLSWGFDEWPETITGLGLAVALIVAERLNKDYGLEVGIKWPNDLLIDGDKLAGILVDVSGDASGACHVVIGLGLNVHQPDWSSASTGYAWTDLASHGITLNRNELVATIIGDWIGMLEEFQQQGFMPLIARWTALSCYADKQVTVGRLGSDEQVIGRMIGVNAMGALLIELAGGEQVIVDNSNLSLRLLDEGL